MTPNYLIGRALVWLGQQSEDEPVTVGLLTRLLSWLAEESRRA